MRGWLAYFDGFMIEMTLEQAGGAYHQGRCDEDVATLLKDAKIREQLDGITDKALQDALRKYGAWTDEELMIRADNEGRIVWIAAGDIIADAQEVLHVKREKV